MKEKRAASFVAGSVVLVGAALLCVSLFSAIFTFPGTASAMSVPGSLLYGVYGFSSFLVPCFFLWASLLLLIPGWSVRSGVLLAGSFAPFLTAAAGEKLIKTLALTIGSESMSRIVTAGLVISTILAIVVEYILLLFVADRIASLIPSPPVSVTFDAQSVAENADLENFVEEPVSSDESFNDAVVSDVIFDDSVSVAPDDAVFAESDDVIADPEIPAGDLEETMADLDMESEIIEVSPSENFAEPFAERENNDSGDFEAASREAEVAVSVASSGAQTPTYVDFEKMRAPFDLPVIEDWVPSEETDGVLDEAKEEEFTLEETVSETVAESADENAATVLGDEIFEEPPEDFGAFDLAEPIESFESPSVSAFDPPMMEDFDDEENPGEPAAAEFTIENEYEVDLDPDEDDELAGIEAVLAEDEIAPGEVYLGESVAEESVLAEKTASRLGLLAVASNLPPVVSIPPASKQANGDAAGGVSGSADSSVDSESVTAVSTTSTFPLKLFAKKKRLAYSVPYDILTSYPDGEYWIVDDTTRRAAAALKETLNEFRIEADVTGIRKGPVITMFEILPAPGVKLSKIVGLQDNIALRLAASSVRIVAPIPGKHAVGIEVPNQKRSIVSFRELIETDTPAAKKMEIPVVLGKDITGEAQLLDLASTPHLLIAGSTGSGKSVCVNSIILSILYKRSPEDVKLILIDPKIVELKLYNDIGHLLAPVITEPKKAFQSLQYCLCEMERRYALLDGMGVRDIKSYNKRIKERSIATEKLPYLVVIIDEFADLMATTGKELESTVARLCAMSRAVGIHLVLATQRPSIDVITGLIKANIPTRIAFMVASKMDSRIIIDQVGAEKLLGKGDMLYASATDPFPVRIQGAFVSEEEVERVVAHVKTLGDPEYIDEEIFVEDDEDVAIDPSLFSDGEDPLYDKALEIVMLAGKASASYIQRKLKIGYNRAARLVEDMEARGIVGPANGSKPREVIHHV